MYTVILLNQTDQSQSKKSQLEHPPAMLVVQSFVYLNSRCFTNIDTRVVFIECCVYSCLFRQLDTKLLDRVLYHPEEENDTKLNLEAIDMLLPSKMGDITGDAFETANVYIMQAQDDDPVSIQSTFDVCCSVFLHTLILSPKAVCLRDLHLLPLRSRRQHLHFQYFVAVVPNSECKRNCNERRLHCQ